jgi:putative oxidoreductase
MHPLDRPVLDTGEQGDEHIRRRLVGGPLPKTEEQVDKVLVLAARFLMALIFIISGWGKLTSYRGTVGYMASMGLPLPAVATPLVILIELGGGLALLVGLKARWAAAILAAFSVGSALIAHTNFSDPNQMNNFLKNLAMAGGYLLFVRYGAGSPAIDDRLGHRS